MGDLARFCCQNPQCPLYGQRDADNVSVCGRIGKHKPFRQLDCNACRARFSERKGTPLYRCHRPESTAASVLDHLAEGNGIRQTGRLLGVPRNTVLSEGRAVRIGKPVPMRRAEAGTLTGGALTSSLAIYHPVPSFFFSRFTTTDSPSL